jgi:hypothetical protein
MIPDVLLATAPWPHFGKAVVTLNIQNSLAQCPGRKLAQRKRLPGRWSSGSNEVILRGGDFLRFPLRQSPAIELAGVGVVLIFNTIPHPRQLDRGALTQRKTQKITAAQYRLTWQTWRQGSAPYLPLEKKRRR